MEIINIRNKFSKFSEHWSPKIIAGLNGQQVKLAKIKGEFDWHHHEQEDELFYVVKGAMDIELQHKTLHLNEGECVVIPKGVEHKPKAEEECWILLFEPASTKNTGNVETEKTRRKLDHI